MRRRQWAAGFSYRNVTIKIGPRFAIILVKLGHFGIARGPFSPSVQNRVLFPREFQKIERLVETQEANEPNDDTSRKRRLCCLDYTRRKQGVMFEQELDPALKGRRGLVANSSG